jgi:hypothetical protein
MSQVEAVFAGLEKAQMFGSGTYFGEGNFDVRTRSLKYNNGHTGPCFIAEVEVLSSDQAIDPATGKQKDPPGSVRSWVVKLGPTNKNAFGDVKKFAFALLGIDSSRVGPPEDNPDLHKQAAEIVKAACDPEYAKTIKVPSSVFENIPLKLRTWAKPTRAGGVFTMHAWSPVATT